MEIEDQVIRLSIGERLEDTRTKLDRGVHDRRLGDRSLLVGRELPTSSRVYGSDNA
jgi:hypothetical protein